jgi:aminoglycoside 6-adenylyltransferase
VSDNGTNMAEIETRFVAWATADPAIRAAVVIGSRARVDHPADAFSDLDLVAITTAPERLLDRTDWLRQLGAPWLTFVEPTAVGAGRERRVLFADGSDVDIAVFSPEQFDQLPPAVLASVVRRGLRVLLDKDGRFAHVQASQVAPRATPGPPTREEYRAVVDDFWYHALWAARKLRRGELFTAKEACDGHMKDLLLRMLAWHAGATRGWAYDTWHRGRFLEEWADPRMLAGLEEAYAHYNRPDMARALRATMGLFSGVARETAQAVRCPYPSEVEEKLAALVATLLDEAAAPCRGPVS